MLNQNSLSRARTHATPVALAIFVTSLIISTSRADEDGRCDALVGAAAIARAANLVNEESLDPTQTTLEVRRRLLLKSTVEAELWRVALRVRTDEGKTLERVEDLKFDSKCVFEPGEIKPRPRDARSR